MVGRWALFFVIAQTVKEIRSQNEMQCYRGTGNQRTKEEVFGVNYCGIRQIYNFSECTSSSAIEFTSGNMQDPLDLCDVVEYSSIYISTCFCVTPLCNTKAHMQNLIENWRTTETQRERLPRDPGGLQGEVITNQTLRTEVLDCLAQNVALLDNSDGEGGGNSESSNSSFLTIFIIIIIVILVLCCLGLPIAYNIREKKRKEYLAQTWDQRVKEAGEQASKTSSSGSAVKK
ncbi:hypothetical protein RB195_000126 [Necator americanus]|uniref:Uncharacterized protein n=1 Tax=Necator americanus TaxID=51031 RepID=A0ABR1D8X3_NECAM